MSVIFSHSRRATPDNLELTKTRIGKNNVGKSVPKNKTKLQCPAGKERNPRTGRCISISSSSSSKVSAAGKKKACPAGKERNPRTGRCVLSKTLLNT